MEHLFLMFLDHTQRRTTVCRTPLDEWSARRRDLYLTTHNTQNRQISMPPVGFEPTISAGERPIYDISSLRVNKWLWEDQFQQPLHIYRVAQNNVYTLWHEKYYSIIVTTVFIRYAVAHLVEARRYKPEGRGFDSRWCHWNFSLT